MASLPAGITPFRRASPARIAGGLPKNPTAQVPLCRTPLCEGAGSRMVGWAANEWGSVRHMRKVFCCALAVAAALEARAAEIKCTIDAYADSDSPFARCIMTRPLHEAWLASGMMFTSIECDNAVSGRVKVERIRSILPFEREETVEFRVDDGDLLAPWRRTRCTLRSRVMWTPGSHIGDISALEDADETVKRVFWDGY